MYRKEVNAQSPLRILQKSIHGGLGKGNLGVVMARAGVGKTACLVHIALDDLMRERPVLHVALEQTVDHVESWYDAIFDDLARQTGLDDIEEVRKLCASRRMIVAFTDHDLFPQRLEKAVEMFRQNLDFSPEAIVVDGYDWATHAVAENAAMVGAFKAFAKMCGAELWMTAQTHRENTGELPGKVPPPCDGLESLIDVAIFLSPERDHVAVKLLVDHGAPDLPEVNLRLHPDTLRITTDAESARGIVSMPASAYTLLSGGAQGAEAEFGACAEASGLAEMNFSFAGRRPARSRCVVVLSDKELAQGAVSSVYLEAHMHRAYPKTPLFEKTLQSIWHQVNTAGEVFTIGVILPDGTVKGGTGWAAELGRHFSKPVHVYDQERKAWHKWDGHEWAIEKPPVITQRRFCGTGTRFLSDDGKAAIHGLFERSFGPFTTA